MALLVFGKNRVKRFGRFSCCGLRFGSVLVRHSTLRPLFGRYGQNTTSLALVRVTFVTNPLVPAAPSGPEPLVFAGGWRLPAGRQCARRAFVREFSVGR